MSTSAELSEGKNPKTGMTLSEMKDFIRNHFEEFVNRKNLRICEGNFAPCFDLRVVIEDLIAEEDKVVVRNHWTGTDAASNQRLEFSGILIWRIANRQIVERWAYLETPHPVRT